MNPKTFIFFGPSGSGKGTQVKLLVKKIEEKDPNRKIIYIETGKNLRKLAEGDSFTSKKVKKVMEEGELLPAFLPVWIWADYMMKNISGDEHIFLDGLSRKAIEAPVLDSAMKFYDREKPFIVYIKVSDKWATNRLKNRGRNDDGDEEIKRRLKWFKENAVPAINYFKENSRYEFIEIDGEGSIEEVHQNILKAVGL